MESLRGALERCLEHLPQEDRGILQERYNHRTPLHVLAQKSGRTEGGLKMALMRLRKRLAQCVEARMAGKEFPHAERTR